MATPKRIQEGGDLMLFYFDAKDSKWKSIAYATSHTLSFSTQTTEVASKDHSLYGSSTISKIEGEFTTSNLYTTEDFDFLLDKMNTKSELKIVYSAKKETTGLPSDGTLPYWTPNEAGSTYATKVIITSLRANLQNGEKASFEATFKMVSEFKKAANLTGI